MRRIPANGSYPSYVGMLLLLISFLTFRHRACAQSGASDSASEISGELMIFHAGSLSVPFKEITGAFNKEYSSVRVLREVAGSRACAHKISDLGRACDVFAAADYAVIDSLLIPEHASWTIKFASNEMVIAYSERSRRSEEITRDNW